MRGTTLKRGERFRTILRFLILLAAAFAMILPIVWAFSTAIKPQREIYAYPPTILPSRLAWENFAKAWTSAPFGRYAFNSVFVTLTILACQLINAAFAAYAFSWLRFKARDTLFLFFLAAMMIPTQVLIVPTFLIFKTFGWIDTYWALIVPFVSNAFGIFLLRQSFLSIPRDLVDAAKIDGCGHLGIIGNIMLPSSKAALISFSLLSFTWRWNDYFWPLIMTNSTKMRTLPVGLVFLRTSEGSIEWNVVMAAAVLVMLPVILLFVTLQRYFVQGVMSSGIKG
jgi:ABC-type glycerol-3-phosphate transport system permease component